MCLAVPGRVTAIYDQQGLRMGRVDFNGVSQEACLAYVPEAEVGDYVIVHVGFALSRLDEAEALATLETFRQMAALEPDVFEGEPFAPPP